ncbi:MAG: VCBS repeat-containing protein [Pseudanabaenaceae cyanobacterium SKYGB_i_bin29]|nr:FG-GAP-like repeat-containing protein [Pseudanabaenaceae cyanobacterium SKYG29]MDW8420471.1 VCBS repeat-containing protein [Pseudanabaenaceae cyanobacterium SKYGB_i_bin29]
MFNPVTLSTPFSPSQLTGYNGLEFFFGSDPRKALWIEPIGDLDNDGYGDLLINTNGTDKYIVYGHAPGKPPKNSPNSSPFAAAVPVDLDRPAPLLVNNKPLFQSYDSRGRSFRLGQDVNGDGLKELVVFNSDLPSDRRSYILFGKKEGFTLNEILLDPGELDGKRGFYLATGVHNDFYLATGVYSDFDGDVNGDGIVDLAGPGFVFFGTRGDFPPVLHHGLIDGSNGFLIKNGNNTVFIRNAKDVNGDGRSDLIVAPNRILLSSSNYPPVFDLTVPNPSLLIEMPPSTPLALARIRPLGDVNRDGFADFAYVINLPWSTEAGTTTLYFGSANPSQITAKDSSLSFPPGYGVYDAADFNNDGFVDLLMATHSSPPAFRQSGSPATYIAFGGLQGFSQPQGIAIQTKNIGDFNGDGITDLYAHDKILFGGTLIRRLEDAEVDGKNGIFIGTGFTPVGDFNGDGRVDLAKGGLVILGTDRINNSRTYLSVTGGVYHHFSFPQLGYTNADSLVFYASNNGPDWVYGGWGNDTLVGESGHMDQFSGGPGNDAFVLKDQYGLQIGKSFAVIWDFEKGQDKVVVHGTANDYFFVEDNNAWLDNKNAPFLKHRSTDTSAIPNTILARRCNCPFGAVMIAAFSDVQLDLSDLVFVPNTRVV